MSWPRISEIRVFYHSGLIVHVVGQHSAVSTCGRWHPVTLHTTHWHTAHTHRTYLQHFFVGVGNIYFTQAGLRPCLRCKARTPLSCVAGFETFTELASRLIRSISCVSVFASLWEITHKIKRQPYSTALGHFKS